MDKCSDYQGVFISEVFCLNVVQRRMANYACSYNLVATIKFL